MNIFKSGEPVDLSVHMVSTYQTLRIVLVVIALAFPWILGIGGRYIFDRIRLQPSMSDYYHASTIAIDQRTAAFAELDAAEREQREPKVITVDSGRGVMRNWFVGVLFAISAILIAYKGFRPAENIALNLAGIFALLVALFPNIWYGPADGPPLHGIFAICFFLCIAYVCIFCASATLSLVNENRRALLSGIYKALGVAMVATPAIAGILSFFPAFSGRFIFLAEFFGVYAFALYWLVKTLEIRQTKADQLAASGAIELAPGKGASDAFRELPVTVAQQQPTFDLPKYAETVRANTG